MNTAIIIPARYASSRLPGKPLLKETGKYLIQHVYEQAVQSKAEQVIVATDDLRIYDAVKEFGGQVEMTRPDHPSGMDRIAEVAQKIDAEIILNLQGDEPLVDPGHLDLLAELLRIHRSPVDVSTLAVPLTNRQDWENPNCVKVVCDRKGNALYFSRSPIPFIRDGEPSFLTGQSIFMKHLGMYGYRRDFLLKLASTPPEPLELAEKLEQLRVLALGQKIAVGFVAEGGIGVDTPDDYRQFVDSYSRQAA